MLRQDYSAFGAPLVVTRKGNGRPAPGIGSLLPEGVNLYGYTGKEFTVLNANPQKLTRVPEQLGVQYNVNRYYDPDTGRWLSPDPLGLLPDMNPYRYVGNGPTNYGDPDGLLLDPISWLVIAGSVLAVGGTGALHYSAAQYDSTAEIYARADWTKADVDELNRRLTSAERFEVGGKAAGIVGVGLVAAPALAWTSGGLAYGGLAGAGFAVGASHNFAETYATTDSVGLATAAAVVGGVFGAVNPVGAFASAIGGAAGYGLGRAVGDQETALRYSQWGSLIGGIAGGGYAAARQATAVGPIGRLLIGTKVVAAQGLGAATGAHVALALGYDPLVGAQLGMLAGGIVGTRIGLRSTIGKERTWEHWWQGYAETNPLGGMRIGAGGTRFDRAFLYLHERVHSILSPAAGSPFATFRGWLGSRLYLRSDLLRYAEERLAHTNAFLGTRRLSNFGMVDSVRQAGAYPWSLIQPKRLFLEAGIATVGYSLALYGAYKLGGSWGDYLAREEKQ